HRLEDLDLSGCGLRTEHALGLTEPGRLPSLHRLALRDNDFGDDVLAVAARPHPTLETIDLRIGGDHLPEFDRLGQGAAGYPVECRTPSEALALSRCPDPRRVDALSLTDILPAESLALLHRSFKHLRTLIFRD